MSELALRKFVDEELTPRFPDGLTVVDGGAQWRAPEDRMLRDAVKVVLIVLPSSGRALHKLEAARTAYHVRFHQEPAVLIKPPACVSF
jgi:hypothetical protein